MAKKLGFLSVTLKQEEIWVLGRRYNKEDGLTIVLGNTGNYLNEEFIVQANRGFDVTESCKDNNKVIKRRGQSTGLPPSPYTSPVH